jgi:hypothetical protein
MAEVTMTARSFNSIELQAGVFSLCTFGNKYRALLGLSVSGSEKPLLEQSSKK